MKLNKFFVIALPIVLLILVILISLILHNFKQNNILASMKNGLDDTVITEIYQNDIDDVNYITSVPITIKYVNVDLNNDGKNDKIVIIRSPIHSGSHGDTLEILLNRTGSFSKVYTGVIRLFSQEWEVIGSVNILNTTTNGFKDIEIITDAAQLTLKYVDGAYQ